MFCLLSRDLNNSWNVVIKAIQIWSMSSLCSVGHHATPVVIRVEQLLGHGLCKFYGKPCSTYCYESLTKAEAFFLLVLLETMLHLISRKLRYSWSTVSFVGNHAPPLVHLEPMKSENGMKSKQLLELDLRSQYSKPCSVCCEELKNSFGIVFDIPVGNPAPPLYKRF